jgi:Tol biopolymer transport system component
MKTKIVMGLFTVLMLMTLVTVTLARRQHSGAWIAYNSWQNGRSELYLMTGDGASVRRITHRELCGANPRWSPDGDWIAFISGCSGQDNLYRIRPGGGGLHHLAARNNSGTPRWSPDGSMLVAVCCRATNLFIVDVASNRQRRFADSYIGPDWSPDGEWIYAFPLFKPNSALERIHVQTGRTERVLPAQVSLTAPSWSPDAAQMVLGLATDNGDELFRMSPDGATLISITDDLSMSYVRSPRWSPDGRWIAFLGGEPFAWHVYRIRPDGRGLQQLSQQAGNHDNFQWSPDGRWLLFAADYGGSTDIYRLRADGSSLQNLTPGGGSEVSPQYAPSLPEARRSLPMWVGALMMVGVMLGSKKWTGFI